MKIVKYIINLMISFLLIFIIISMLILNLVSTKILDKNYILSKLEETEFYLQVSREAQSGFEKYIYQSGLPEDIIKDLYTEEILKTDVNSIIDNIYEGAEIKTSESKIKETLDIKINQYMQAEGKKLTPQIQDNIKKFENIIMNEYRNTIRVSDTAYNVLQKAVQKIKTIYEKVKYIPIIVFIIMVILLIAINRKHILLGINFIAISLLSVGILLKLAEQVTYQYVDLDNLVILTKSISNFVISISKELLYAISDYGTWFIVSGVTGIIMMSILRNRNIGKRKIENKKEKVKKD